MTDRQVADPSAGVTWRGGQDQACTPVGLSRAHTAVTLARMSGVLPDPAPPPDRRPIRGHSTALHRTSQVQRHTGAATGEARTPDETRETSDGAGRTCFTAAPAQRLLRKQVEQVGDLSTLADVLRLGSTLHRVLGRDRLRHDTAGRVAVSLGRHPGEPWPEWFSTGEAADR